MSGIEWTDKTWNPVTGCTKVSPGCTNCYAEAIAHRFWNGREFSNVQFHRDRLDQPYKWKKPCMIFVNSMGDLFHEAIEFNYLCNIFEVMVGTPQHTYQVLTKRPKRMLRLLPQISTELTARKGLILWEEELKPWPRHIWFGVSVENKAVFTKRILSLVQVPAQVRFLSCEPLLEGIAGTLNKLFEPGLDLDKEIHWIIVGGESGNQARPFNLQWAKDIQTLCHEYNIPFFFKQAGSNPIRESSDAERDAGKEFYASIQLSGKGNDWNDVNFPEYLKERNYP